MVNSKENDKFDQGGKGLTYFICQVGKAVNQTRQFTEEIRGLFKWMTDASDFLKDQEPAAGDPETLEAQLDQSEVRFFFYLPAFFLNISWREHPSQTYTVAVTN